VIRPEKVLQARPARLGDGGADGNDLVDLLKRNVSRPERARAVGVDRLNDIADKGQIPRASRGEARRLVAAPDELVGGALDVFDPVAVGNGLVAGEIEHPRAARAQLRADREQDRVAEPAAEQHGLARRRLGRRPGRAHQHERLSRLQEGTEVGRAAHLEDDRRQEIGFLVDRGTG